MFIFVRPVLFSTHIELHSSSQVLQSSQCLLDSLKSKGMFGVRLGLYVYVLDLDPHKCVKPLLHFATNNFGYFIRCSDKTLSR